MRSPPVHCWMQVQCTAHQAELFPAIVIEQSGILISVSDNSLLRKYAVLRCSAGLGGLIHHLQKVNKTIYL